MKMAINLVIYEVLLWLIWELILDLKLISFLEIMTVLLLLLLLYVMSMAAITGH